ncbi:sigma-54 interaction domain-containing protein [Clostridium ihumii]|uniref:sigma-54 interaction domain-containing protein n=1 Tax=Clostridium ihumii TaxID=1470356 RepID=UPI000687CA09|nr:sigma 54-interacting transcriptional regulator [Clostridium ihumii]
MDNNEVTFYNDSSMEYDKELQVMKKNLFNISGMSIESNSMMDVLKNSSKISKTDITALILGETGVGKEGIAKYIHYNSKRKDNAFITINCGAIPENLIESELFGYEPGAFTGANKGGKIGLFQLADGGTIFLDEVGELPLTTQVKLLRVLQEKQIEKVGGVESISVDIRIIAATNKDLKKLIDMKLFREDLYYRLSVFPIVIPPLRERKEDIKLLIDFFTNEINEKYNTKCNFSENALECLYNYEWPGNVRELKNIVERQIIMNESNIIYKRNLDQEIKNTKIEQDYMLSMNNYSIKGYSLKEIIDKIEIEIIEDALERYGNVRTAAKALQIDPSTLIRKKQKYFKNKS